MRFFFLFVFLFSSFFCKAQLQGQPLIDSLLKKLPSVTEDSNRIKLLNWLSFTYKTIDPNEGIRYAQQQLELAKALDKKKAIASAYNLLGLNYQYKSDYPKALEYYHKALMFFAERPGEISSYGNIISNIAFVYQVQGNLDKALEYNFKSLKINQELDDTVNIGGDYGNIGAKLRRYVDSFNYSQQVKRMNETEARRKEYEAKKKTNGSNTHKH